MKLAVIGCGGVRSMFLAKSLAQAAKRLDVTELAFMDNSEEKLAVFGGMAKRVAEMNARDVAFTLTSDAREAVKDADYVITTIRVGGDDMRVNDERAALNAGVIGQETMGAAGFAFAMRSVPALIEYLELIRLYAKPNVKVFNFTNPAGVVSQALRDAGYDFTYGICDAPSGMLRQFAELYGAEPSEVCGEIYGLNHCSFFRNIYVRGKDIVDEVAENDLAYKETDLRYFGKDEVRAAKAVPNEYLYYYYYPKRAFANIINSKETRGELIARVNKKMLAELKNVDTDKDFYKALEIYSRGYGERESMYMANETGISRGKTWSFNPIGVDDGGYAGVALRYMEIVASKKRDTMIMCVPNCGAIPFLKDDDVVEITSDIEGGKIYPHPFNDIPEGNKKLLMQVKEYERLASRAILTRSRSLAVAALEANPLVKDKAVAEKLVDIYIKTNEEFSGKWTE